MAADTFSEDYIITSFMVNLRGRAGLYTILNLVQDVGWQHATQMGVQLPKGQGWVFTRQKLQMSDWPKYGEVATVKTWLRNPGTNPFILRDYEIYVGDRKLGDCTSTFTVFDTQTRKMVAANWGAYARIFRNKGVHATLPLKIPLATEIDQLAKFEVRNSDIDLNNHVNNTRYAQWVLDAIPIDMLRRGSHLTGYEVNFLAEMKIGDVVYLQKAKAEQQDGNESLVQFQGIRETDLKTAFTAILRTQPQSAS